MTYLAADTVGEPGVNIAIFVLFVAVTLVIVVRAVAQQPHRRRLLRRRRAFTGPQNGIAISGDYLSAASFLGIAGAIAINGYDGFLYSIGFLVAWLVALLLVAELLRNTGRFTMADVLSFRMRQRPVRTAAAITTLAVSFFYLLAQMAGAGGLVALLLGVDGKAGQSVVIAVVGVIMIIYVLVGGMKGTTWVQIVKAALLITGAGRHDRLGARQVRLQPVRRCSATRSTRAASRRGAPRPGKQYGITGTTKLDFISLSLALVLGTAGLPHVLMRFYTVPDGEGGAPLGRLGDLADRHLLPVHPGPRLRRRGAGRARRRSPPHPARPTRRHRCSRSSSAARCCSASSRRSRSPRSSRSSPA